MTIHPLVKFIVVGEIHNEFIIDVNGKSTVSQLGGPPLYTAASLKHWGESVGLVTALGVNTPLERIHFLQKKGLDIRGIRQLPHELDLRAFYAYGLKKECLRENPVAIYSHLQLEFPKELIGYAYGTAEDRLIKLHEISQILAENFPPGYKDAVAAHITPLDLTSQIQISTLLLKGSIRTITLQPHPFFMNPKNWDDFTVLVKDSTAVITCETDLRSLFKGRSEDLWEMMESVASFGCKFVIVSQNSKFFSLFDATNLKKFRIPRYPVSVIDPTGEIDAFCGAFLSGFQNSYDPLAACIQGSATASIVGERSGPFSIDECLPGLDHARMEMVRGMVSQI